MQLDLIEAVPSYVMFPYQCEEWRNNLLKDVYPDDAAYLRKKLIELDDSLGYIKANDWLKKHIERYQLLNKISFMRPTVRDNAERIAKRVNQAAAMDWLRSVVKRMHFCDKLITSLDGEELASWAEGKSHRFEIDLMEISLELGEEKAREFVCIELRELGYAFDGEDDPERIVGMAARMITPEWWIRLAKKQWTVVENILRECGEVHRGASPYVSYWSLNKFRKQRDDNRAFLESMEAVNDLDQSFTLAELSDKGVSNPVNRRNELMVRLRGCEELSDEMEHVAVFLTATCPSKFHPVHSSGQNNGKFLDAGCPSVRDANAYMVKTFAQFRSYCKRHGIMFYGMRAVEPHHDATPHWHLLLFINPEQRDDMVAAFTEYFMREDRDEKGAAEYRITVEDIDKSRGSAVGYIAKYIAKNIDGEHVDGDLETNKSGKEAAERITAWARRHRIRQFQFVGGVSVTVWRELRRLKIDNAPASCIDIYHAANRADWKQFMNLMGGPFAGRNQTLKTHYVENEENQYGEITKSIKGVETLVDVVTTRLYEWTVQRKGADLLKSGEAVSSWTRVNNCTDSQIRCDFEKPKPVKPQYSGVPEDRLRAFAAHALNPDVIPEVANGFSHRMPALQ